MLFFKKKSPEGTKTELEIDKETFSKLSKTVPQEKVSKKLTTFFSESSQNINKLSLKIYSKQLSDKEEMKKAYFTYDFETTKKYFSELSEDGKVVDKLQQEYENTWKKELQTKKIKVKLVILEESSSYSSVIHSLFSPFNKILHGKQGRLKTAIILGPWYLEWSKYSLCIPKKCLSSTAHLALDVDVINMENNTDFCSKLSEIVAIWNVLKQYDEKKCNCQHFSEYIFKEIGLDQSKLYKGSIGDYLNELKNNGFAEITYKIPMELKEKCKFEESKVKFQTHRELDQFVKKIYEIEPLFRSNYEIDYNLLKSFDRAFWIKLYYHGQVGDCIVRDPSKEIEMDFTPLKKEEKKKGELHICDDCPFGDPIENSILM